MTFDEAEDVLDGIALLSHGDKTYKYCTTAAEVMRRIKRRVFEDTETGEEVCFTYDELRSNPEFSAKYL